jgi:hypothetical protein
MPHENNIEIQTHEEWAIEITDQRKQAAYADPLTGSDRFFAKASRLRSQGMTTQAEAEDLKGLARYVEIKEIYSLEPAEQGVLIPESVSRAQGKYALITSGLWSQVLVFMESLPEDEKQLADIALNDTVTWRRDSAFLIRLADAIDITTEELDNLFVLSGGVEL